MTSHHVELFRLLSVGNALSTAYFISIIAFNFLDFGFFFIYLMHLKKNTHTLIKIDTASIFLPNSKTKFDLSQLHNLLILRSSSIVLYSIAW